MSSGDGEGGMPTTAHLPKDVRNQWYCVALSKDVPAAVPGRAGRKAPSPMALSLLGDPIVVWRDLCGAPRCVADKCPHRSAPLSLGRVDQSGAIECLYHGWQVDGASGKTAHIPALMEDKSIPSAGCRVYPVFERDGLTWVWPGQGAHEEADLPPQDLSNDGLLLSSPNSGFVGQSVAFDLPIDHSLMVENLMDPAHIPFTHEGTISHRGRSRPMRMKMVATKRGFRMREDWEEVGYSQFIAPCNVVLHTPGVQDRNRPAGGGYWTLGDPGKRDMYQFAACTPTAPGQMRIVFRNYRNWAKFANRIPPLRAFFDKLLLKIIFQDYTLLLGQQQRLREGAEPWNAAIQCDMQAVLYRRYYKATFGNTSSSGPWWRGWGESLDIESLEKLGSFDRDFDCHGCALPKRPHHPQNVLEESGKPGMPIRPSPEAPRWPLLLAAAAVGAAAAMAVARRH